MSEIAFEAAIANSVVALTRHDMQMRAMTDEEAFRAVCRSDVYRLVCNPRTRLCLESDDELCRLYDIEINRGAEALRAELLKRIVGDESFAPETAQEGGK